MKRRGTCILAQYVLYKQTDCKLCEHDDRLPLNRSFTHRGKATQGLQTLQCTTTAIKQILLRENPGMDHESLMVHESSYSHEELLIGPDVADELALTPDTFLEIRALVDHKGALPAEPLVLRPVVLRSAPIKNDNSPGQLRKSLPSKGGVRISILRPIADAFKLSARQAVSVRLVTVRDAALDWVELSFKDQQLTRGDIWHFRRHLVDREPTVHVGKTIALAGIRAQVYKMVMRGRTAAAGVLTEQTKLRFRSRSAAFVLLIQVGNHPTLPLTPTPSLTLTSSPPSPHPTRSVCIRGGLCVCCGSPHAGLCGDG